MIYVVPADTLIFKRGHLEVYAILVFHAAGVLQSEHNLYYFFPALVCWRGRKQPVLCSGGVFPIQWCWELLTLPQEGGRAEVVTVMASIWWERRRGEYHVNSCLVLYCQEWNYPGLQAGQSQLLKGLLKEVYTYLLPVRSGNFLLKNGNEIVIVLLCLCISTNYIAKDSVFPVNHIG